jgi:group I intron endonuclease
MVLCWFDNRDYRWPLFVIIYLIRNKINGKGYVGQTIQSLQERWINHLSDARRGSSFLIHSAIRKHGENAFELSILSETDNLPDLNLLEIYHIDKQNTKMPAGYNRI